MLYGIGTTLRDRLNNLKCITISANSSAATKKGWLVFFDIGRGAAPRFIKYSYTYLVFSK